MKKYLGFFIVLTLLVLGANYAQATTNVPVVIYSSTEASSIIVLSPNGGEVVNISKPVTVTFKSNNPAPAKHYINLVDVNTDHAYSLDSLLGSNGLILTQEQINQSTQSITVSAPESIKLDTTHNYLIEICVNNICDKSDSTFKITSTVLPLTQIYPTGCNSAVGFSSTTGLPCFLDTNPATSITKSSAVLNGRIFANTPANLYFNYKKAGNGNEMFTTPAIYQQDNGSFSYTLPGLISNTKYEFKVCMPYANLANTCSKLINFTTSASYIDEVIVNPTETGCSNSEKYSSTTGKICPVVIENGCNGTVYSTTTGQKCNYVVIDPPCSSNEINCYPNKTTVITSPITRTLKIGVKGEDVKTLQSFFKITADGVFGKMTAAKVMEWQKLNGLTADGLFGVKSLQKANIIQ